MHCCPRTPAVSLLGWLAIRPPPLPHPSPQYGSMVNERVGASNWDSGAELGDTWASRNAFR